MSRLLNIACLQTKPCEDFQSALGEALGLAEVAVSIGAELVALPEYCGGLKTAGSAFAPPAAPEESHPVLIGLREFARERGVWMIIGSVAVPTSDGRIANRCFVVDSNGQIQARYDKLHLFDIQLSEQQTYRESDLVNAGNDAVVVDVLNTRIGLSICYDLRFPTLYRDLSQAGAELLMIPAAFTKRTGEAHWHVLNRARAIENGAFVVSPCAIGMVAGGGESYGHSLIVNPWGEVLADGGSLPGVVHTIIDLDEVTATRAKIASLQHDRDYKLGQLPGRIVA